ncbi:unnamed protein product [Calypogeia fissa]
MRLLNTPLPDSVCEDGKKIAKLERQLAVLELKQMMAQGRPKSRNRAKTVSIPEREARNPRDLMAQSTEGIAETLDFEKEIVTDMAEIQLFRIRFESLDAEARKVLERRRGAAFVRCERRMYE